MPPKRTSFTSSLPPILDGTTFCLTPHSPHTTQSRPFRPKLPLPSPILSLSPPRGSPRTHAENSFSQQFSSPPDPFLPPPLEDDADESHSSTSCSDDEFEEIFASSPIEQYSGSGSPESDFTSSPCTSRSNSPCLIFSPKAPPPPTILYSTPPGLRESHVAGLYFMKPLVLGVMASGGRSNGSKVERGLDIQQVNNCKRASTPASTPVKTSTTRGRSSSSPARPTGLAGRSPSISRYPSANSGKQATGNIIRSITAARSVPSSPVLGSPVYNRQF